MTVFSGAGCPGMGFSRQAQSAPPDWVVPFGMHGARTQCAAGIRAPG